MSQPVELQCATPYPDVSSMMRATSNASNHANVLVPAPLSWSQAKGYRLSNRGIHLSAPDSCEYLSSAK